MHLKELTRKYILVGIVILIIGALIFAKVYGSKQDEEFKNEDALYQYATQLYQEGKFADATTVINELLLKQPRSEMANYLGGLIAANNSEYAQSAILLQKSLEINPHKVEDEMFMLQFAEVLVFAERYNDAKNVLERCREANWSPETYPDYQARVTELLTQIENMQ